MRKGKEIFTGSNSVESLIKALGLIDDKDSPVGLGDCRVYDEYEGKIVLTKWVDQQSGEVSYEVELNDNEND